MKTFTHNLKFPKLIELIFFIGPALVFLLLFWVIPIVTSMGISFTDWDYMTPDFQFVGLDNYQKLMGSHEFRKALSHTLVFALETVVPSIFLGFMIAFFVLRVQRCRLYPLLIFAPWITPAVAVSLVWTWMMEPETGLLNSVLVYLHQNPLPWLHSSSTALAAVALVTVWKNLGYVMLLFMGGMVKIPKELYEAASVDGAGEKKKLQFITLPLCLPTIWMVSLIMVVEALRAYDQIQILTQGGPSGSTRTLLYLYYQLGFEQFRMGEAAATVVILMGIALMLSLLQSRVGKGGD